MLYFNILKLLLNLVLLPSLLTLYLDHAKTLTAYSKFRKFTISNKFFWYILPAAILVISIEIYPLITNSVNDSDGSFQFLTAKVLDQEISKLDTNSKREVMQKFDHIEYAWQHQDYTEVINNLRELERGFDSYGKLPIFESYVIYNNLGCAYFKVKRNKDFLASSYLMKAKKMTQGEEKSGLIIEENLRVLDNLVNKLD